MKHLIFRLAVLCLLFWALSPVLLDWFSLEFSDKRFEESFNKVRFFGLPFCVFLAMVVKIKASYSTGTKIGIITLTLGITMLVFIIMTISLFGNMCEWTTRETLFTHKTKDYLTIVKRDYGCGATDSTPGREEFFLVRSMTKYFVRIEKVQLENLEQGEWQKIN